MTASLPIRRRHAFLHRKIGGKYLMATKLQARVALRRMVEAYCHQITKPR